jgi:hypothetical protein
MKVCPISPLPFAPSLARRLERISHTILPRLAWTFRVEPRPSCYNVGPIATESFFAWRQAQHLPNGFIAELAEQWPQGQLQIQRNLGMEIYIDTLLAGSQIGERLPLANRRIDEEQRVIGLELDLSA